MTTAAARQGPGLPPAQLHHVGETPAAGWLGGSAPASAHTGRFVHVSSMFRPCFAMFCPCVVHVSSCFVHVSFTLPVGNCDETLCET